MVVVAVGASVSVGEGGKKVRAIRLPRIMDGSWGFQDVGTREEDDSDEGKQGTDREGKSAGRKKGRKGSEGKEEE